MAIKPPGLDWTEPQSTFVGEYPYAHVTETESGHLFAMDDTKDSETVRLSHRLGTFTEFQKDGTRVDKIVGDGYQIIAKNNFVLIKGVCNIVIEGDSVINVKGDADLKVEGDAYTLVEGDSVTKVTGDASVFAGGDLDLSAGGALGTVTVNAPNGINLNGDVTVNGLLTAASSIYAGDNVIAAKQLFSYLGIQTLGGINSGFTSESPVPPGVITSTVTVTSPIIFGFASVQDGRGSMELIRQLYNVHIHGTPHGRSTTPTPVQ
jgi:hypothetical protein